MNQGKRRSENGYGHDDQEWGLVDNSEKLEWEEHYEGRNRKWVKEDDDGKDEEMFRSEPDVGV